MAIVSIDTVKTLKQIAGTDNDAAITLLIPIIEADFLRIRNTAFDTDDLGTTVYPGNAELVASEMIFWRLMAETGRASESMGNRSYQNETMVMGYPLSIVSMIDVYAGTK